MMTVAAARALTDGMTCFVGIGLPSAAANLARATHAPNLVLIYESGTIGAKPRQLPLSIGDGILAETADAVVSVPEIFNYWLQPGRIDVGFLGAAQIDKFGNINTTVVGDYEHPAVRLPGAGGAPEIAASCAEVIVIVRQSRRTLVEKVDFVTSVGYGDRTRRPRASRLARSRPAAAHHRPGRPDARPADLRVHHDRDLRGRARQDDQGANRLGPGDRRVAAGHPPADRGRARRAARVPRRAGLGPLRRGPRAKLDSMRGADVFHHPERSLPTLEDYRAAATRIAPYVRRTPVLRATVDGRPVTLKLEHLQVTGVFKIRGALNALLTAQPAE